VRFFRQKYKDRRGRTRESSKVYGQFRDHAERVRRLPLYTDEKASREAGRKIEKLISLKLAGAEPDADLTRWLSSMDAPLRNCLAKIGLLDAGRIEAARPLPDHLNDWQAALLAKGTSEQQAKQATARARRVLVKECAFKHYGDVTPGAVRDCLAKLREPKVSEVNGKLVEKPGLSAQTSNHILTACRSFCIWMVREGRALSNPLACLTPLSEKVVRQDQRHARRMESAATVARFIATTAAQPTRWGMTGTERALLYRLAVETGLRAGELADLTRLHFRLDATTPHVAIHDGGTKNGREADVPLLPGMIELLKAHTANMLPNAQVFSMPAKWDVSNMFYEDLEAAGIAHCDTAGRFFDFHALRHCTGTYLGERGVDAKIIQDIMRHADLRTTQRYLRATVVAKRAEVLRTFPSMTAATAVREATTDAPAECVGVEIEKAQQKAKTPGASDVTASKDKGLDE